MLRDSGHRKPRTFLFAISDSADKVAGWSTVRPPEGWLPATEAPLDQALPRGWPARYLAEGQLFAPSTFMYNAFAISNFAARDVEEPLLRALANGLVSRLLDHSTTVNGARYAT